MAGMGTTRPKIAKLIVAQLLPPAEELGVLHSSWASGARRARASGRPGREVGYTTFRIKTIFFGVGYARSALTFVSLLLIARNSKDHN